mgnify:CR=1 FL=1
MSNVNTKNNVRTIAVTGMLSAVAVVLMYLEIPIPIMPGLIKFDFSDLPALLGAYALGPVAGIIICLIKNVVHLAASQSMLVGELSNFILGSVFVFTAGIVYKKKKGIQADIERFIQTKELAEKKKEECVLELFNSVSCVL